MTISPHDQPFVFTGSTSTFSHIKPKLQTMMTCINRDENTPSVAANNNTTATPAASSSSNPLLTMPFVESLGISSSRSRALIHHVANGGRANNSSNTSSSPSFAYRIDEERHLGNISINHQHEQQRLLHRVRIQQILEEAIILVDECENTMRGYNDVEVSATDASIGQASRRNPRHSISLVEDGTATGRNHHQARRLLRPSDQ